MPTPPPVRAFEYWLATYRRTWRGSIASGFVSPALYLAAMGPGLGSLVDERPSATASLGGLDYVVFLAPGLLAATAFQTGVNEASYPVMAAVRWVRTYHAQLATPLRPRDVVAGHLLFMALRLATVSTLFVGVMTAFGASSSWRVALAVPASVLAGLAVAAPVAALSATIATEAPLTMLMRFGVVPSFLFSGTFFPVSQLPAGLRPVAWATPLWHGVDLCRELALAGTDWWRVVGHVAYLSVWLGVGLALAVRCYAGRLTP